MVEWNAKMKNEFSVVPHGPHVKPNAAPPAYLQHPNKQAEEYQKRQKTADEEKVN